MQNITKRLSVWALIIALLLIVPLVLTLLGSGVDGDGWHWTFFDFVFASVVLFGSALTYELVARKGSTLTYRVAVGVAVVTALLFVWINAAVGIIGDGDFPNALYFVVLVIGLIGAIIARFKPLGMSRILFAMAFAQFLIPVIALAIGTPDFAPGVVKVFILNTIFVVMFIGSGLLFRRAASK